MKTRPANKEVFLICRFDEQFNLLFQAMIFAIKDCGFEVRCALEDYGTGRATRIDKIMRMIDRCQYCVADISLGSKRDPGRPRLNMSMELGAFYHSLRDGRKRARPKSLIVMDTDKYLYQQTISNLSGIDIHPHGDEPKTLIVGIQKWLQSLRLPGHFVPPSSIILADFAKFQSDLPVMIRDIEPNRSTLLEIGDYNNYVEFVNMWLKENDSNHTKLIASRKPRRQRPRHP
jgi:hypothetical protein